MSFKSLGLSEELLSAVADKGYHTPSPIQAKAIPATLSGRDILAAAQTGTGKTAGFTLPLLHRLSETPSGNKKRVIRSLILTPTRELAIQVAESVETYGAHLPLKSTVVFGGVNIGPQKAKLRSGVDILVATPGRLLDLHQQNIADLSHVEIFVLDEADRMLDMGFIHDIRKVLKVIPKKRQNLMFSATFSKEIKTLTQTILKDPITIEVAAENTTADTVEQQAYRIDKGNKPYLLKHLIQSNGWNQVLVFTRTKHGADKLAKRLEKAGIKSAAIHGNKSQNARVHALNRFKDMSIQALVATDIAARGIDIKELPHVVNYELPNVPEDYVHRIGRTGRAGSKGHAVSLVAEDERPYLSRIEKLMDQKVPLMKAPKFSGPPPQPQANASKKKSQRPERRDEPRGDARDAKLEGDANPKPKTTRYQKPKPQGKPGARPDKKNQTTTTGTKPKSNKRHGRLDERISKKTNPLNRKPQG